MPQDKTEERLRTMQSAVCLPEARNSGEKYDQIEKGSPLRKTKTKQSGGLPLVGGTLFPGGRVVKA